MIRRFVISVAVLLGVVACGGTHTARSTVMGIVRGYGGPAIIVHGKPQMAINGAPMKHTKVTATGPGGLVATTTTDQHGRFTLSLPPGRYAIRPACGQTTEVSVPSYAARTLALQCDFP